MFHTIKRRCNQAAQPDDLRPALQRLCQNLFRRHHHAQVYDLEPAALQHDGGDVLAYVVHVSLHSSYHHLRLAAAAVLRLHIRLKHIDRLPHHLCRLHYLRQEHPALAEQFSDLLHTLHQRPLDDSHRAAEFRKALQHVVFQPRRTALDQRIPEPGAAVLNRTLRRR